MAWVTIGAGVVTSLLTLYALMRVWDAAFWRPKPAAEAAAPHASRTLRSDGVTRITCPTNEPRAPPVTMITLS